MLDKAESSHTLMARISNHQLHTKQYNFWQKNYIHYQNMKKGTSNVVIQYNKLCTRQTKIYEYLGNEVFFFSRNIELYQHVTILPLNDFLLFRE